MSSWYDVQSRAKSAEFKGVVGDRPAYFAATRILGDCLFGCEAGKGEWLKGATITLFTEAGKVKMVVRNPNTRMVAFVTLNGEATLQDAMEAALASPSLDWRKDKEKFSRA